MIILVIAASRAIVRQEDGGMNKIMLSDYDVALMLIKMLLEKREINDRTASAAIERINEMRNSMSAA